MILFLKNDLECFRPAVNDNTFKVTIAGDCCPWEKAIQRIKEGAAEDIIAEVKPYINDSDLRIIQFESPLTNQETPIDKSGPNLKCPPECIELAKAANFNIALLANNHIGDHGAGAALETIQHFNNAGIKTAGAGKDIDSANTPLMIDNRGIKIAILNFAENEFGTAKQNAGGCAPLAPLSNIKAIQAARQKADLVFVIVHGGHERNPAPSPRMVNTYRAFAEAGASMVMNIHTHCPEGIELWNGVPIVYSPGNFFFPWEDISSDHLTAMWWTGYIPKFHCDSDGVYALEIMPYRFDNEKIYCLKEDEKIKFYNYMQILNGLIIDSEKMQSYFEAWTAHEGSMYLSWIRDRLAKWPIELDSRDSVKELLPVRNMFTCESHNDMITQYLRLVEEKRVNQALEGWEEIEKLQSPEWAEKYWNILKTNYEGNLILC